ncbi:hypothetical protein PO909_025314 [Leuciscus waleckii]
MLQFTQGRRSVAEFAIEFRTLPAESEWDQRALKAAFHRSHELTDELAYRDPGPDLESLIDVAIRLDNRIWDRQGERRRETRLAEFNTSTGSMEPSLLIVCSEEPMQLGRTQLSQVERERRIRDKCCLCCGSKNSKPDTLSRQFDTPEVEDRPEPIIPGSKVVAGVQWGIELPVKKAQ